MFEKTKELKFASEAGAPGAFIQLAPMIDILFQMICFYLVVGTLVTGQKDPDVRLPVMASLAARPEDPAELVVNLRPDGQVSVGGEEKSLPALHALLRQEMGKAVGGAGDKEPLRVVVRADRRQRYARLDEVLKVCRQAGCGQVVFRALEREGP